jgi:hypothetical protein
VVLLGATVVQFMERSPDRLASECVCYHLGCKLALGLELEVGSFHPTTLCNFRERLLAHEKARVAFDAVLGGLVEAGLVSRRSNQRLDSTHVLGLVARMSRLECVREALRLALVSLAVSRARNSRRRKGPALRRYDSGGGQSHARPQARPLRRLCAGPGAAAPGRRLPLRAVVAGAARPHPAGDGRRGPRRGRGAGVGLRPGDGVAGVPAV